MPYRVHTVHFTNAFTNVTIYEEQRQRYAFPSVILSAKFDVLFGFAPDPTGAPLGDFRPPDTLNFAPAPSSASWNPLHPTRRATMRSITCRLL